MKKIVLLLSALALAASAPAMALELSPVLGLNQYHLSTTPDVDSGNKVDWNYGVLLGFDFVPMFVLETGIINTGNKRDDYAISGTELRFRGWEIPLMARGDFGPLNIGFGGYYETFGKYTTENSGVKIEDISWPGSSHTFGLKGSVRLKIPLPLVQPFVDLSYKYGLSDRGATGTELKDRAYALMAGVTFKLSGGSSDSGSAAKE